MTEEAVEIRVSRGQGNSSGEIARMFRATRCVAIYAAKTCLSTEWQMIASGTWSNANYRKLLSKRFRRSRPKSTMRLESVELFIAGMPNPPSILNRDCSPQRALSQATQAGRGQRSKAATSSLFRPLGSPIRSMATILPRETVKPITLMGCPSSTMRASAALISKILGPRD